MGLAVSVGSLSEFNKLDGEAAEWIEREVAQINQALSERSYGSFLEPSELPKLGNRCSLSSYPYSWLHYLRRAYAHTKAGMTLEPLPDGVNAADDTVTLDESAKMESHLLCHSDAEGFFVPIDFPEIVFDDRIAGSMVGSSFRLQDELRTVAGALGITLEGDGLSDAEADRLNATEVGSPFEREIWTWFSHWETTRLSIAHSTMVFYM